MWLRTGAVASAYLVLIALGLALLAKDQMFVLADLLQCGLRTLTYSGQSFSFAEYSSPCVSTWQDLLLCSSLSYLQTAGEVLMAVLGMSIGLELAGLVEVVSTHRLIRLSLKYLGAGLSLPRYVQPLAQALAILRWITLLDPLLNLAGLVLWVVISDVSELSRHYSLALDTSFILQVVRCALSLGLCAVVTIEILEHRRQNARLLSQHFTTQHCLPQLEKRQLDTMSLDETASRSFAATCT